MAKRIGSRTIELTEDVRVAASAAVAGKKEGEGPLKDCFDYVSQDSYFAEDSWEKAETSMLRQCFGICRGKAGGAAFEPECVLGGDLLNQCVSSSFALKDSGLPYLGLYGACSTMAEALCLAALLIDGGGFKTAAALTGSHFCTAERQYRFPLEYGGQRTPTSQWTVTGSGCVMLSKDGHGPRISRVTPGRIVDAGIIDANNMGAAMAPAAYDTLRALFSDTRTSPADYDLIVTGDLGRLGHEVVADFFARDGVDMTKNYKDCGLLLYDLERQDMHMGGSGCGCSAAVLNGYLLRGMREGKWNRIVFAPTGALLSPTSAMQGESIPGVCHAVILENIGEES